MACQRGFKSRKGLQERANHPQTPIFGLRGVPNQGSSWRSNPINPDLLQANTSQSAMVKSIALVDADPAMM